MAAAPIASTDLCQRGLHRVCVILVHLFAATTALRADRNRSRHQKESRSAARADADLRAPTSPPNPNVNRQDLSAVESRGAVGLLAEDVGVTDVPG